MASKKHTYTVALPDGTQAARTTARTYTHVVALVRDSGAWTVTHWCGSVALAQKQFSSIASRIGTSDVVMIPVDNPRDGGSSTPAAATTATTDHQA